MVPSSTKMDNRLVRIRQHSILTLGISIYSLILLMHAGSMIVDSIKLVQRMNITMLLLVTPSVNRIPLLAKSSGTSMVDLSL